MKMQKKRYNLELELSIGLEIAAYNPSQWYSLRDLNKP
jgi:hypothetical protein